MGRSKFATRLNSFRVREREYWRELNRKPTTLDLIKRASTVAGLNSVDLNYPDHLAGRSERDLIEKMGEMGISLNGYAMRCPASRSGIQRTLPPPFPKSAAGSRTSS